MKVELGGGFHPRGDGFVNCDLLAAPGVDHVLDFERLGVNGVRLPFDDDSVEEVYSSHCLEHVRNVCGVLREIARICRVGAKVEIRVPHWLGVMAMCPGHLHVIGEASVRHWCVEFIAEWWSGCAKRLHLVSTEYVRWAPYFDEARRAFPKLTDAQLEKFIPGCVHEVRYVFEVIPNG